MDSLFFSAEPDIDPFLLRVGEIVGKNQSFNLIGYVCCFEIDLWLFYLGGCITTISSW